MTGSEEEIKGLIRHKPITDVKNPIFRLFSQSWELKETSGQKSSLMPNIITQVQHTLALKLASVLPGTTNLHNIPAKS